MMKKNYKYRSFTLLEVALALFISGAVFISVFILINHYIDLVKEANFYLESYPVMEKVIFTDKFAPSLEKSNWKKYPKTDFFFKYYLEPFYGRVKKAILIFKNDKYSWQWEFFLRKGS